MDEYVRDLLRQWQLEELIPKFEDEEVNEKAFKCLTDDIIRELIPKLGKRAIFNNAYRAYREALDRDRTLPQVIIKQNDDPLPASSIVTPPMVKLESTICRPPDDVPKENDIPCQDTKILPETLKLESVIPIPTIKPPSDETLNDTVVPEATPTDEPDSDPEPPRITFSICALENPSDEDRCAADSLRQFLRSSETVNHILGKTFLTRSSRNLLAKGIVDYLYGANDGVLSNSLLRSWARAVEQVFGEEISGLYFRETENGSSCGGKLVQCYERLKQTKDLAEKHVS